MAITTKTKIIAIVVFLAVYGLGCLCLGHRNERLEWEALVAKMEQEYEQKESEALRQAERMRQEQEKRYVAQMEEVRAHNAELVADALRVRKQFAQIQSRRSPDLERSHHRIERCEQLLSEAYSLAGEGEALLNDRDARLNALK